MPCLPYACLSHAGMEAGRLSACALLQTSAAADLLSTLIALSLGPFNLDQVIPAVSASMFEAISHHHFPWGFPLLTPQARQDGSRDHRHRSRLWSIR